jgi:hypothetical protein
MPHFPDKVWIDGGNLVCAEDAMGILSNTQMSFLLPLDFSFSRAS